MTEAEQIQHRVAMATRDLMASTQELFELSAGKSTSPLVCQERNDIELAYSRIGRMLSQIRREA